MSKINPVASALAISVVKDASEAIKNGYFYRPPVYRGLILEKAVVVEQGTEQGNPTVDLILRDPATDQLYVAMVTGRLLAAIPCVPPFS